MSKTLQPYAFSPSDPACYENIDSEHDPATATTFIVHTNFGQVPELPPGVAVTACLEEVADRVSYLAGTYILHSWTEWGEDGTDNLAIYFTAESPEQAYERGVEIASIVLGPHLSEENYAVALAADFSQILDPA